jgi:hypothetical protein
MPRLAWPPAHLVCGVAEVLDLCLGELAHTQQAGTRRDLIPVAVANLQGQGTGMSQWLGKEQAIANGWARNDDECSVGMLPALLSMQHMHKCCCSKAPVAGALTGAIEGAWSPTCAAAKGSLDPL